MLNPIKQTYFKNLNLSLSFTSTQEARNLSSCRGPSSSMIAVSNLFLVVYASWHLNRLWISSTSFHTSDKTLPGSLTCFKHKSLVKDPIWIDCKETKDHTISFLKSPMVIFLLFLYLGERVIPTKEHVFSRKCYILDV